MKRYAFILIASLFCATAFAQQLESGSLLPLQQEKRVKFAIEFMSVHGMTEDDFNAYEKDWYKDKPAIVAKFLAYANQGLGNKLTLGNYPNSKYTVKAVVVDINVRGDYLCDLVVLDSSDNEIAKITDIRGRGGVFGTKLNLIKDGAEHTGENFGLTLLKYIRKPY